MNNIPSSLFLGPVFLIALFLLCVIAVAGIKILYFYVKRSPIKLKPEKPKKAKPRIIAKPFQPEKVVRSIEINPDEVDRIYVKKVS